MSNKRATTAKSLLRGQRMSKRRCHHHLISPPQPFPSKKSEETQCRNTQHRNFSVFHLTSQRCCEFKGSWAAIPCFCLPFLVSQSDFHPVLLEIKPLWSMAWGQRQRERWKQSSTWIKFHVWKSLEPLQSKQDLLASWKESQEATQAFPLPQAASALSNPFLTFLGLYLRASSNGGFSSHSFFLCLSHGSSSPQQKYQLQEGQTLSSCSWIRLFFTSIFPRI